MPGREKVSLKTPSQKATQKLDSSFGTKTQNVLTLDWIPILNTREEGSEIGNCGAAQLQRL